jgi:Tfp pilus assembly protein PilV
MAVKVGANRRRQRGATLIEVLIAGALLLVMMAGILPAFVVAMNNNHKSKLDSTGIMLAQSVLEQIIALEEGGGPNTLKDGLGNILTINHDPGGANMISVPGHADDIDFTQATPIAGNYSMDFHVVAQGTDMTGVAVQNSDTLYDVRWHVEDLGSVRLITVAARPKGMTVGRFSIPVTLRTIVGPK